MCGSCRVKRWQSGPELVEISRNSGKLQQDLQRESGICRIGACGVAKNRNNRTGVRIAGWMAQGEPGKLRPVSFPCWSRQLFAGHFGRESGV